MNHKELETVIIVWLLFLLLLIAFGCKSVSKSSEFPGLDNYSFQTSEELEVARVESQALQFDVRFDGVAFGQARMVLILFSNKKVCPVKVIQLQPVIKPFRTV
jgi:preprotein translocase subunit SecF